jgi:hypothetical protein
VKKRTVTTIETHQIVIVRRPRGATLARCPACLKEVELVSLEEASLLAGVSLLDICRHVTHDDVHLAVTENGGLVCLDSLLKKSSPGDRGFTSDRADIPLLPAADLNDDSEH